MAHITSGVFKEAISAQKAVDALKKEGFTNDVSVIARDVSTGHVIPTMPQNTKDVTAGGAVKGGLLGGVVGLLAGASAIALPGGLTLLVAGPLVSVWGMAGAALGALGGGLVAGFAHVGYSEDIARSYQERITKGDILVAVSIDHEKEDDVIRKLKKFGAEDVLSVH